MAASEATIPYSGSTLIALEAEHFAAIQRTVALLFRLAHSPAYQALLDADAEPVLRHAPGNFGVFMGYDFHLTPHGPRLIEVNTNAGGALLNGLHTASLCDPERSRACARTCCRSRRSSARSSRPSSRSYAAVRGPAARLARVAIVDERPREQFLYPEFELFQSLFARAGIEARIADTRRARARAGRRRRARRLARRARLSARHRFRARRASARACCARPTSRTPSSSRRRRASTSCWRTSAGSRSSPARRRLRALGVAADDARWLATVVPETRRLAELGAETAWRTRAEWVFKPAASFGSRAVYRGDKISRKRFDAIAQRGRATLRSDASSPGS